MAVQAGETERAVVPIENSLEGGVAATLDALAGEAEAVRIAAEVVHPIHHCLIAAGPLELGEWSGCVSHPQATAQCAALPARATAGAERVDVGSTAEAVRRWSAVGRAVGGAGLAAGRRALRLPRCWPSAWRTAPTT